MSSPAALKPFYTSDDLIEAVKRKMSLPLSQQTFSADDILKFASEEMYISIVPSVMVYNQEYFVMRVATPLINNQNRYPIPSRAIGMRFRDIFYQDTQVPPNLFDMSRVNADDKAFFQANLNSNSTIHKFYLEGNDVVLVPIAIGAVVGSLVFFIYLRPNQLVQNSRAAICTAISSPVSLVPLNFLPNSTFIQLYPTNTITIPNHGFVNGNKVLFSTTGVLPAGISDGDLYYVISAAANTFQISTSIGGSATDITDYGSGLHTVTRELFLTNGIQPADIDFSTDTITITNNDYANDDRVMLYNSGGALPTPFDDNTIYYIVGRTINTIQLSATLSGSPIDITFNGTGTHYISSDLSTVTFDAIPSNITDSSYIDFLQTESGHKTFAYDVLIPSNGISSNTITFLTQDIPTTVLGTPGISTVFQAGDYICSANECIIPQIPDDLHNVLAEQTCARIMASMGDNTGLQTSQAKIADMQKQQGMLLDNRSEGNAMKINARGSILRYSRISRFRRF